MSYCERMHGASLAVLDCYPHPIHNQWIPGKTVARNNQEGVLSPREGWNAEPSAAGGGAAAHMIDWLLARTQTAVMVKARCSDSILHDAFL
jgi:hypothetical protein